MSGATLAWPSPLTEITGSRDWESAASVGSAVAAAVGRLSRRLKAIVLVLGNTIFHSVIVKSRLSSCRLIVKLLRQSLVTAAELR
jgi:hypothetical protein